LSIDDEVILADVDVDEEEEEEEEEYEEYEGEVYVEMGVEGRPVRHDT